VAVGLDLDDEMDEPERLQRLVERLGGARRDVPADARDLAASRSASSAKRWANRIAASATITAA
jgi:hypothetical protein